MWCVPTAGLCTQLTTFRMAQAPHPLCPLCLTLGNEQSIPACPGAQGQHRSSRQKKQNWVEVIEAGCQWLCTLEALCHSECDVPQCRWLFIPVPTLLALQKPGNWLLVAVGGGVGLFLPLIEYCKPHSSPLLPSESKEAELFLDFTEISGRPTHRASVMPILWCQ